MKWDYRVMRTVMGRGTTNYYGYAIYEVYTDNGKVSWAETPVYPIGESVPDLADDLETMLAATRKPVLDAKTGEPVKKVKLTTNVVKLTTKKGKKAVA